jgi:hypothetical protein
MIPEEAHEVEVGSAAPLVLQPPDSREPPVFALKALAEGVELILPDRRIFRPIVMVRQRNKHRHNGHRPVDGVEELLHAPTSGMGEVRDIPPQAATLGARFVP